MVRSADFDNTVPLPTGLDVAAIRRAIEYIENELNDFAELYFEQANVFSALVGMFGTKALHQYSQFEKHKHPDVAQQRFPDLCRHGAKRPLKPKDCLESKASKRSFAMQSHYDHAGWYIVWRYLVDPVGRIETGKHVVIWRVDVVFLEKNDWKYEGSKASAAGGGRTHTFGVKKPAEKLAGKAAYKRTDIVLRGGKPVPVNGHNGAKETAS
jgi:hypothetical protein